MYNETQLQSISALRSLSTEHRMSSDRCLLMMLKLLTSQHGIKQYGVFGLFGLQNRSKRLRGVGLVTYDSKVMM